MTSHPIAPALTPIRMRHSYAVQHAQAFLESDALTSDAKQLLIAVQHAAATGRIGKAQRQAKRSLPFQSDRAEFLCFADQAAKAFRDLRTSERLAVAVA